MSWGHSQPMYGHAMAPWGHQPLAWGHYYVDPWGRDYQQPWGHHALQRRHYIVGVTLDEGLLKDTLDAKHEAETLYGISQPVWMNAFKTKSDWENATNAASATREAYQKAHLQATSVLNLPQFLPQAEEAKGWAKKYDDQFTGRIRELDSILTLLKAKTVPDLSGLGAATQDTRPEYGTAVLMVVATVAAFAGGGALLGWVLLHSPKAAMIGGGVGLAAGALTQIAGGALDDRNIRHNPA